MGNFASLKNSSYKAIDGVHICISLSMQGFIKHYYNELLIIAIKLQLKLHDVANYAIFAGIKRVSITY